MKLRTSNRTIIEMSKTENAVEMKLKIFQHNFLKGSSNRAARQIEIYSNYNNYQSNIGRSSAWWNEVAIFKQSMLSFLR